jgi:hypothetical protein
MKEWEWISTGGDSLCDDMAGTHYGDEPARPHPNCGCDVSPAETETDTVYQVLHDDTSYERTGAGDYDYTMHFSFDYSIQCADGSGQSGQIVIDRDYKSWAAAEGDSFENTDGLLAEVWDEASDQVASIAEQICPPEEPKLYS